MTVLKNRVVAALKRTAQNNYPLVAKRQKLEAKIDALKEEIDLIDAQIEGAEIGSKALTGGYTSFDLIDRVVTTSVDAAGNEVKKTSYIPKPGKLIANEDGTYTIVEEEVTVEGYAAPVAEVVNESPVDEI